MTDKARGPESIVWLPQQAPHLNYSAAKQYGELRSIVPHGIDVTVDYDHWLTIIETWAHHLYEVDRDYILLTGDPLVILLVGLEIPGAHSQSYSDTVRVLRWDGRRQDYDVVDAMWSRVAQCVASD